MFHSIRAPSVMLSPIDGTFTSFSAEKNRTDVMFGVAVPTAALEREGEGEGRRKSGGEGHRKLWI